MLARQHELPAHDPAGAPRPKAADLTGTYVVCLDCGREFPYDWSTMKIVSEPKKEPVETTTVYER